MAKVPKQITSIFIETGIQFLKIVKDLNDNDELFQKSEKHQLKKGVKNDTSKATRIGAKKNTADSH